MVPRNNINNSENTSAQVLSQKAHIYIYATAVRSGSGLVLVKIEYVRR